MYMARRSRAKTFSDKCLDVSVDVVIVISFALAASFLINVHILNAPTVTQAVMIP